MRHLPPEVATLYAELVEQLTALEARRSIGHAAGSFVTKEIGGQVYLYFQHTLPGGGVRQIYLGRRTAPLAALVARFGEERADVEADRAAVQRLCAELRAGGAAAADAASARVLAGLADAAVFRLGGVLVGTHAFVTLGNMLGVRWDSGLLRTEDIDIAGERTLHVAVPDLRADIPGILESLAMGFLPVPGLSPAEPTTSFKVRGRALRVDLLTPAVRGARGPVPIPRFGAAAQALPFLDYLLDEPQGAAVVDGGGVLVNVPHPARFALHKLLVAQSRSIAFQTKSDKDLRQAAQLVELLGAERPGELERAWASLVERGAKWARTAERGLTLLARRAPALAPQLDRIRDGGRRRPGRGTRST
jgi:hypothetical protein